MSDKLKKIEKYIKECQNEGFLVLFHSTTIDQLEKVTHGISGGAGPWIREIASSSYEHPEELLDDYCLTFFDKEPAWTAIKVAKKLNKSIYNVSENDIENHGVLCITSVDPDDYDFKIFGERGGDYDTDVRYLNGEFESNNPPFGVEPGDYFSTARENPVDHVLTGKDIMEFTKTHYPDVRFLKLISHVDEALNIPQKRDFGAYEPEAML